MAYRGKNIEICKMFDMYYYFTHTRWRALSVSDLLYESEATTGQRQYPTASIGAVLKICWYIVNYQRSRPHKPNSQCPGHLHNIRILPHMHFYIYYIFTSFCHGVFHCITCVYGLR